MRAKGSRSARNLVGGIFCRLTVVRHHHTDDKRFRHWLCRCSCGETTVADTASLTSGRKKSCGCLKREATAARNFKHGASDTPEHLVWKEMKRRCMSENRPQYKDYGGRGIKVCERWLNSFAAFLVDVGPRPSPKHSIERKDNDGDYEPGNVRWATRREQSRNKRTNRFYTFRGEKLCLQDWAERFGIRDDTLRYRLKVGWSMKRALTTPGRKGNHGKYS